MIDRPLVYPFYEEAHFRRGRTVQRPVVLVSIGDPNLTFDALVDSGSEHVLADSTLEFPARAAAPRSAIVGQVRTRPDPSVCDQCWRVVQ